MSYLLDPTLKTVGTIIADAWKDNDLEKDYSIYKKKLFKSIHSWVRFVFLGIWVNIDNILEILGDDYLEAKWVIFFIAVSFIDIDRAKNLVISLSKAILHGCLFLFPCL